MFTDILKFIKIYLQNQCASSG